MGGAGKLDDGLPPTGVSSTAGLAAMAISEAKVRGSAGGPSFSFKRGVLVADLFAALSLIFEI